MAAHYRAKHPGRVRSEVSTSHHPRQEKSPRRKKATSRRTTPEKPAPAPEEKRTPILSNRLPSPISPLVSPIPIRLYDFPTLPEKSYSVSPARRNLLDLLFDSPEKEVQPAAARTPARTVVMQKATASGSLSTCRKKSQATSSAAKTPTAMVTPTKMSTPASPYSPTTDSNTSTTAPSYDPTPIALGTSTTPAASQGIKLKAPAPPYLPVRVAGCAPPYGKVYEHLHHAPPETDTDPRCGFAGAPSLYDKSRPAEILRRLRLQARIAENQAVTIPEDQNPGVWLRRVEKAVLPDGTIYELSSTWFPDPTFIHRESKGTNTTSSSTSTGREEGTQTTRVETTESAVQPDDQTSTSTTASQTINQEVQHTGTQMDAVATNQQSSQTITQEVRDTGSQMDTITAIHQSSQTEHHQLDRRTYNRRIQCDIIKWNF